MRCAAAVKLDGSCTVPDNYDFLFYLSTGKGESTLLGWLQLLGPSRHYYDLGMFSSSPHKLI